MKTCSVTGCNNPVWSNSRCRNHVNKKPLQKSRGFINKYVPKKENTEMRDFFISIWNKRPHKSELSGEILFEPVSSAYFHHILPKRLYKEAEFDEENIILLTIDEHANVENNIYKYEKINYIREKLKLKYNLV